MDENKYLTAIFFDEQKRPYKYRGIRNNQNAINSFINFARTKKATEINFYSKVTKLFLFKFKF